VSDPLRKPDTIVLIHGLWMTPRSWEHYAERYEAAGYVVHAPAWPGLEEDVEALNADPTPLGEVSITGIVDHYAHFIRGLTTPPIIMGHSFGGLFMQLLVDRGFGAAGIGLSAAQPRGINRLPLSTLHSGSRILRNPGNRHRAVRYTLKDFHYTMTNTLTLAESEPYYRRYAVPGAGPILFEGALANLNPRTASRVEWTRADRAPLLFVGFEEDHVIPPSITKAIVKKHTRSGAVADYVGFPGRPHFPGAPGWEAVADSALEWAEKRIADAEVRTFPRSTP
jgi:pimeloyl-ACP methyl ester carboxylesterase